MVAAELEADGVLKVLAYDTGVMDVQPGHRLGGPQWAPVRSCGEAPVG